VASLVLPLVKSNLVLVNLLVLSGWVAGSDLFHLAYVLQILKTLRLGLRTDQSVTRRVGIGLHLRLVGRFELVKGLGVLLQSFALCGWQVAHQGIRQIVFFCNFCFLSPLHAT